MKFVQYVLDTEGELHLPAVQAPVPSFASAEDAVQAALSWEHEVTAQITALMDLAVKQNDYLAQSFLQWFIDEQLEEVVKMDRLLSVIKTVRREEPVDGRGVPRASRKGALSGISIV